MGAFKTLDDLGDVTGKVALVRVDLNLPMDGGHIAIAWYEKARSWIAIKRGKIDPGRVDYMKLMPLTYAVIVLLGGFMLLTITADIVNPITIFN